MGNTFTRDTNDTIHWNSLKTDKLSDDNNYSSMSNDSKLLLNRLELNLQKGSGETEVMSDIDNIFSKPKITISKSLVQGGGGLPETITVVKNDLSDTSPFISSEMYNLLINNNESQKNGHIQKGGKIEGDDSSTSSTSSSDDSSSETEEKKKGKKGKKSLKGGKISKHNKKKSSESSSSSSNPEELSYISSSAHTEKSNEHSLSPSVSESSNKSSPPPESKSSTKSGDDYESSSDGYKTSEKSNENSTIPNLNEKLPKSSINTSDINMITESTN